MRVWKGFLAIVLLASPAVEALGAAGGKVFVEPFTEANQKDQPDWINRALQQSASDDLAAIKGLTVVAPDVNASTRPADADYIVSATLQRVSGGLRVTGRVEDTATHQIVGGFKATGSERDLFAIEDSISTQLKSALGPEVTPVQPTTLASSNPAPPHGTYEGSDLQRSLDDRDFIRRMDARAAAVYQPVPDYTYTQPAYPVDYGYGYNYPPYYYDPGYYGGWWGGSVVVIGNNHNHHHDHDHHWNGNGNGRPGGGGGGFIPNPTTPPTRTVSGGGGRIPTGMSNPNSLLNNGPAVPQLVPNVGVQNVPTVGTRNVMGPVVGGAGARQR